MNDKMKNNQPAVRRVIKTGKECAYLSVFVALLLTVQLCLSFFAGVEIVTLLCVAYAYTFGIRRSMLAATAFSLLRQLIFGFFPSVLLLYLLYFNLLALCFGIVGGRKSKSRSFWLVVLLSCICTVSFTLLDDIITPVWYAYTAEAARGYFVASLPIMVTQTCCVGVTVGLLFLPLERVFRAARKRL